MNPTVAVRESNTPAEQALLTALVAKRDALRAKQERWTRTHGEQHDAARTARIGADALDEVLATQEHPPTVEHRSGATYPRAAAYLRLLAEHRGEYAHDLDDPHDPIAKEVRVAAHLARILEGDPACASAWLPSWRWTDEISAWLDAPSTDTPRENGADQT